jgi:DUF4097 and DUF4098 domain-containing protein YvlB
MDETPVTPLAVRISSTSHRVRVLAEARADVLVDGRADVEHGDTTVTVSAVGSKLAVHVPVGTSVVVGSSSGRVDVTGPVGDVAVLTESGRIAIDQADAVDVRTDSARVTIGSADGPCRVRTRSGAITIESCTGADVSADSGRIVLRHVTGPVHAHCVTGRIEVGMETSDDVAAETVSGRISISLPGGVTAFETTEPDSVVARPSDCDCTISARSVTGRIEVETR